MKAFAFGIIFFICQSAVFAEDYSVIVGSSLSQGVVTAGQGENFVWAKYAKVEGATGMRWDNLYQTGTESAYMWARVACLADEVVNHGKEAPEYIFLVSRHFFWTLSKARVTQGASKYKNKTKNQVSKHKSNPDSLKKVMDDIIAKGPDLKKDFSSKKIGAYNDMLSDAHKDWWDFNDVLDKSFLPHIVADAHRMGSKLVLWNNKTLIDQVPNLLNDRPEIKTLYKKYMENIIAYCRNNGVYFMDMTKANLNNGDFKDNAKDDHISNGDKLNSIIGENMKALHETGSSPLLAGPVGIRHSYFKNYNNMNATVWRNFGIINNGSQKLLINGKVLTTGEK